jgi:bacterioferritin
MELSRDEVIDLLNRIVELELAGAVRYTQYSLMVFDRSTLRL